MKVLSLTLCLTLLCLVLPARLLGQEQKTEAPKQETTTTVTTTGAVATAANAVELALPDGTEFEAVLQEEISSGTATEGDPVNFKVDEDVKVNGKVVIAKDTLVKGTIANAQKAGRMGKGGKLGIRVESTTAVDGQKVRLRASKGNEGGDKVGTVIALSVFFGLFGLLKKGNNAKIKAGTKIKVYTDEAKAVKVTA
ncbi:MAG: hypothetical protein LC731_03595 [Acidobacteria bacterium]|nr:hypothetical protein [Acidobacteriota bacterium]